MAIGIGIHCEDTICALCGILVLVLNIHKLHIPIQRREQHLSPVQLLHRMSAVNVFNMFTFARGIPVQKPGYLLFHIFLELPWCLATFVCFSILHLWFRRPFWFRKFKKTISRWNWPSCYWRGLSSYTENENYLSFAGCYLESVTVAQDAVLPQNLLEDWLSHQDHHRSVSGYETFPIHSHSLNSGI